MRNVIRLALCLALVATAGTAMANNHVAVTGAAAIEGSFGMEIQVDGSTNAAYVQDNTPDGETVYRAQFWIDKAGIYMSNCGGGCATRFVNFLARQETPPVTVFRGIMGRLAVDQPVGTARYTFRLGARKNDASFAYIGGVVLTQPKNLMIEWTAGNGNGIARLYSRNNTGQAFNLIAQRTNLVNDDMVVDYIRWGAVSGLGDQPSDTDNTGAMYVDSFESYRTLAP